MKDFAVFSCTCAKYVVPLYVFIEMNMQKHIFSFFALLFIAQMVWADSIASSVSLSSYYATVNNKSNNELRLALFDIIKGHTQIGYKQLGVIMQYSDTENADGKNVVDIYTNCTYTCNGALSWISSGDVGAGMNREHTVPQSWFNENEPMKSDAFHVYPTDSKANNNRSSFLFGEFSGAGTSYSTSKCSETGKKGSSEWTAGTTSYTYNNQTYVAATTYTGTVYEPADEYKGDLARSYFYMATRYADICANWTGGAFGDDNNGLADYTAELMLKWHRLDPVSEKELIRNEVIYGNELYNKSDKKQGNRNPFIDFPELVEYIWGDKKDVPVAISTLSSQYLYENEQAIDEIRTSTTVTKILRDGQLLILINNQEYNILGQHIN